jgi:hypothetical protein
MTSAEVGPHRIMTYTTELDSKISYSFILSAYAKSRKGASRSKCSGWWCLGTPGHMHFKTSYIISNEQTAQHFSVVQESVLATAKLISYPDRTNNLQGGGYSP